MARGPTAVVAVGWVVEIAFLLSACWEKRLVSTAVGLFVIEALGGARTCRPRNPCFTSCTVGMIHFRVVAQVVDRLTKAVVLTRVVLRAGRVLVEDSAAGLGLVVVH